MGAGGVGLQVFFGVTFETDFFFGSIKILNVFFFFFFFFVFFFAGGGGRGWGEGGGRYRKNRVEPSVELIDVFISAVHQFNAI